MKYCLLLIVFISCLCCGCANKAPVSDQINEIKEPTEQEHRVPNTEEVTTLPNSYTFPPDNEEFAWWLKETGMSDNWYVEVRPSWGEPNEFRANHLFNHSSGLVQAVVSSMCNQGLNSADDYSLLLSMGVVTKDQETPLEAYNQFEQKELPRLWTLAGNLIQAQDEVEQLREQCMVYFDGRSLPAEELNVSWKGRQGNVQCRVTYTWHKILKQHVFYSLDLNTAGVFDTLEFSQAYISTIGKFPFERSTVAETDIYAIAKEADEGGYVFKRMKGHIEQLEPNSDSFDSIVVGVPDVDLYQKGLLVDETGSMPVYLAPTVLTESELKEELIHFVAVVNSPEPYCVIVLSAPDYYDF